MPVDPGTEPQEEPTEPVEPAEEPEVQPATEPDEEEQDEGEEPDEPAEGDEPAEEEQPAGPQPPATPEQVEARMASWDRERDRHMRELDKRDDYRYANSSVCPICQGHGLVDNPRDEADAAMMRQSILALVGGTTAEELRPHPTFQRCPTCDGQGKVYTGSQVPDQASLNCPDCNGQGHTGGKGNVSPFPLPQAAPAEAPVVPPEE